MDNLDVAKMCVASRVIIFLLQAISNILIPNHQQSMSTVSLAEFRPHYSEFIQSMFGGLSSWDGEHYLYIAQNGYAKEFSLAFFPLYPFLISFTSKISQLVLVNLPHSSCLIISAFVVNIFSFTLSGIYLSKLTKLSFPKSSNLQNLTIALFCFNPSNIFFSAIYTESLFSLFTFSCLYYLKLQKNIFAVLCIGLACFTRSNGITLCVFLLASYLKYIINYRNITYFIIIKQLVKCFVEIFVSIIPFLVYQLYSAYKLQYEFEGLLPYSFIQSKYWNLGLLRFYQLKQLPNFILAAPIILLSLFSIWNLYCESIGISNSLAKLYMKLEFISYGCHFLFLLCFGLLFMHVQVLTRLILASTPCIYWYCANILTSAYKWEEGKCINTYNIFTSIILDPQLNLVIYKAKFIVTYFVLYNLIGLIMFPNYLPWT